MNPEIYLTPAEKRALTNSGDDAAKSLYQQGVSGAITLESCKGLTTQEQDSLLISIAADKFAIQAPTKTTLLGFLAECKKNPGTVSSASALSGVPGTGGKDNKLDKSPDLTALNELAKQAKQAADLKIKEENPDGSHLSNWRALWKFFPGTEPTIDPNADDIKQVINQSREWNDNLVDDLVKEYKSDSVVLPVNWFSNLPGWFPTLKKNHNFNTDGYAGKYGIDAKRAYIADTLVEIKKAWDDASVSLLTSPTEWGMQKIYDLAVWGLLPLASTMWVGKMVYNAGHGGSIKKAQPGEAAMWTGEKIWDGTKWVTRKGVALGTGGLVKLKPADKIKATSDTPAYDADAWKREKARLEEATRRMIYMDSGVNPRHNPNATSAEIFREVENIPALKTTFDARMKKLTELGNTLVGQDRYLSQEAFNKEAAKIVAGDIGENSVRKAVLKRVPFTAEREAFKQTQAALKKVKGEIDTMRVRLSAKAMMDGVEIPKELESQLQAFEDAYKKAHEADFNLDKSRNNITKAYDRINAINEVISHFEDIEKWEGKIAEVKQKIADVEARIAAQRDAAHTESEIDRRNREVQGADEEIRVAKESLEQARTDQSRLESEIKDARRELKAANDRIDEREKELKDAIATREKELKDAIATREKELKDAIAKSESSQEAMNPEEVAKRDAWNKELRREEGDLKRLSDELNGSDTKLKSLKDELNNRTGELKKLDNAKADASDNVFDLVDKKPAAAQKVADIFTEYNTKVGDKRAILGRAGGVDAKSLTSADQVELAKLKEEKSGYENKIKETKGKIDTLASANKGFPRSTGGTLALAQAELARTETLIAPGGTLDAAKIAAKTARDRAFTHLNTTITTLNAESTRLGAALDIQIPHIAEFVKGQNFADDLSMRENGTTGDKAADNKLKGTRAKPIETILKGGRHGPG